MFAKVVIGACILAVVRGGLLAEPAYASYAAHGYGSHFGEASPYLSSYKHLAKLGKPAIYAHAAPIAHRATYAAPIAHHAALATTYASHHGQANLRYAGHSAHSANLLGVAYSPAVAVSHVSYSSPLGTNYGW